MMIAIRQRFPRLAMFSLAALLTVPGARAADPVLMDAPWATSLCAAWNRDQRLMSELHEWGWVTNDKGRGYKVIQIYREDCPDSPRVELRIGARGERAECLYGGAVETATLDNDVDYVMSAETARWQEMGAGEYGPMKAMMFGRLSFDGPMLEAMGNMGPFAGFLKLTGAVPGTVSSCPSATTPTSAAAK